MRRLVLAVVPVLWLQGCFNQVEGGAEVSKTRTLEAFSRVRIESGLTARFSPGSNQATVTAPQKVEENLQTLVLNDTLVVRLKPGVTVTNLGSTEVVVSGDEVNHVESTHGSTLTVSEVAVSPFLATATGGSTLVLAGATQDLRVDVWGGSTVTATALPADFVSITVNGGSTLEVHALKQVGGTVSGGSSVTVRGPGDFSSVYVTEGSSIGPAAN